MSLLVLLLLARLFLIVVKPLTLPDPFGPPAFPLDSVFVHVNANAILLAVFPLSLVKTDSIGEGEFALPMSLVILESALILRAIRKHKAASAMHLTVEPLAFVRFGATLPGEDTLALYFVLLKFTLVFRPIRKSQLALALFDAQAELPLILHAILFRLDSVAILLPIFPLAVVDGPVGEKVLPFAVLHV